MSFASHVNPFPDVTFGDSALGLALRAIYVAIDDCHGDIDGVDVDMLANFKLACRYDDHQLLLQSNFLGADISLEEARMVCQFVELADHIVDSCCCDLMELTDGEFEAWFNLAEAFGFVDEEEGYALWTDSFANSWHCFSDDVIDIIEAAADLSNFVETEVV